MLNAQLLKLNQSFGIQGQLSFRDAGDGFIVMDIQNDQCVASVALQGAHVMTWQPKDEAPVIWMSPVAKLAAAKSIRGGVPICWPWFGPHVSDSNLPAHGFARTSAWDVISTSKLENGACQISFCLQHQPNTSWPYATRVEMHMMIGAELEMTLQTYNLSDSPMVIGQALHTYFCVDDVRNIVIHGLEDCDYIDKVSGSVRKQQQGSIVVAEEVDRIYLDQGQDVVIEDFNLQRRIHIHKENSHATIVWNPWLEKCKSMGDFGADDGYLGMVCVESANADEDVVTLAVGDTHRLSVRYSLTA